MKMKIQLKIVGYKGETDSSIVIVGDFKTPDFIG